MKKVLSNNIATGVRQPYTKVTHEWYNAMRTEAANALARMSVGSSTTDFIILFGCDNTNEPNADISAGAIFYNGEIYLCPAFVDASITNAIVGTITTTYDASDPVLFSDGNSYNVHEDKIIVWSDAASGTGDVDFDDLVFPFKVRSYTPTMGTEGGGTATGTCSANYFVNANCVTINLSATAITVTGTPTEITFSVPTDIFVDGNNYTGMAVCMFDNGSSTNLNRTVSFPSSSGSEKIGVGADLFFGVATFPAFTGGAMRFQIQLFRY
jgi:hypothetical protein